MKKISKILYCIFSVLLLISISPMAASAKATAIVSAEAIAASDENIIIPINISSETQLMGFKISVAYNEQVKVKTVSRGSVTSKGNFNTNFGVLDGKFDIIWNNTSPVEADGTLFALTVDTSEVTEATEISLSFSQPDTFDGKYNDVILKCEKIKITVSAEETTNTHTSETSEEVTDITTESTTENISETENVHVDGSQITDSVNNALDKDDIDSIYDVENEEDFLHNVNENLQSFLGYDQIFFTDFDSLLSAYESYYTDSFISGIIVNMDSVDIQQVIDEALDEVNSSSIDKVKNKEKFVQKVEEKVKEIIPDNQSISEYIDNELVFESIKRLYNTSAQTNSAFLDENSQPQNAGFQNYYIYVISGVSLLIVALVIALIIIKRKRKNNS